MNPQRHLSERLGVLGLAAGLLLAAGGCANPSLRPTNEARPVDAAPRPPPPPSAPSSADAPVETRGGYVGEVVRVNAKDGYVIVRCRRLPREGEEATVMRNQWQHGRLRFTGPMQAPFAAADILRGEVQPGDAVQR